MFEDSMTDETLNAAAESYHRTNYSGNESAAAMRDYIRALEMKVLQMRRQQHAETLAMMVR